MSEYPVQHHNNAEQEHKKGNPVHAVHEFHVYFFRIVGIRLAQVEIPEYLLPHSTVSFGVFKITKKGDVGKEMFG